MAETSTPAASPKPPGPVRPLGRILVAAILVPGLALAAAPSLGVDLVWAARGAGLAVTGLAILALVLGRLERIQIERAHRRLEGEVRDASRRAQVADERQRQFLTNMSHELRTPLAGILGLAEMLQNGPLEAEQQQHLLLVQESTRGLLAIVDDLLDVGKLGAGAIRLEQRRVDVARLVKQTASFMAPRASAKGLGLNVDVDPDLPAALQADPTRLRQILVNLLSNAIKFTEQGDIHVRLEWLADRSDLRLEVEDPGIGIPEAAVPRLFSPFQQVDSSTSRRFGGTGLGLAICKSLTELMGGRIGVSSKRGEGSTFWLELPLEPPRKGARAQATPVRTGDLSGRRLLVVEDDAINRLVVVAKLESLGAVAETCSNGKGALERLATERFDLVLMDCQMPELDGYQTTELLRNSKGPSAVVPVVALTAHAHPDERTRCLEAGMNDFLTKPVETEQLYTTLREWLDLAASLREPSGVITLGGRVV